MSQIARVAYAYNSILETEGSPSYFLDALVMRDGATVVDIHQTYKSREEFFDAIEEIIPVLDGVAIEDCEGEDA